MTPDFKDKLAKKKAELKAQKYTETIPQPIYDPYKLKSEVFWMNVSTKVRASLVYTCVFLIVMCGFIITDWWTFIGTKEYHQYKLRIEEIR